MDQLKPEAGAARRVVVFGEALLDRSVHGRETPGGAPFNVAWNLAALGAEALLVSRVGEDDLGARIVAAMVGRRLSVDGMQIDRQRPTGVAGADPAAGDPEYEIPPDRAFDRIDEDGLPANPIGSWLYHGTLAVRGERSHRALGRLLRTGPDRVFFDVNLRSPWWGEDSVRGLLQTADDVRMSETELEMLVPGTATVEARALDVVERYDLQHLYVTRGSRGAIAFSARGESVVADAVDRARIVDPAGASDAFCAVLLLGRLRGWSLETRIERAREFATGVLGLRGATTVNHSFYETYARQWESA